MGICLSGSDGKKVLSRASKWYGDNNLRKSLDAPTVASFVLILCCSGLWLGLACRWTLGSVPFSFSQCFEMTVSLVPWTVHAMVRGFKCASRFYVRIGGGCTLGFFMLISQFQDPSHFLMAYLEDYKMDPSSASPLVSFSIFNDLADAPQNLSLVRCDILNANIQDHEGLKVVQSVLDNYRSEDDFGLVRTFNERPASFDVDDYISRMNDRWKQEPPCV